MSSIIELVSDEVPRACLWTKKAFTTFMVTLTSPEIIIWSIWSLIQMYWAPNRHQTKPKDQLNSSPNYDQSYDVAATWLKLYIRKFSSPNYWFTSDEKLASENDLNNFIWMTTQMLTKWNTNVTYAYINSPLFNL